MAHFAQLDEHNMVLRVVVVSNDDIVDNDGNETEALGVALCEASIGPGVWLQTSFNSKMRRRYAGIGMIYSAEHDAFLLPQPYPSWIFDITNEDDWVPPIPAPAEEGYRYEWNEQEQGWIAHEIEQPTE